MLLGRLNWLTVHRQLAIYATGCLLVGGALGITLHRDKPVHSAGDYLYFPNVPSWGDPYPTFHEFLGNPETTRPTSPPSAPSTAVAMAAATVPASPPRPAIVEYTVQEGDTIWDIAAAHGTDEDSILSLNDVRPTAIQVGDTLKIPNFKGAVYKVEDGDTVSDIATAFGMSMEDVLSHNNLADVSLLKVGQMLILPGAKLQPQVRNQVASRGVSRSRWVWPVIGGSVSSEFGPRWGAHHAGLDVAAPTGTPVVAARAGQVISAGWDGTYGLSVVIDHGDGIQTRYAHASSIAVNAGDWVDAGDFIMGMGSTGFSTGPHLHFEVIVNGVQTNPRAYLP